MKRNKLLASTIYLLAMGSALSMEGIDKLEFMKNGRRHAANLSRGNSPLKAELPKVIEKNDQPKVIPIVIHEENKPLIIEPKDRERIIEAEQNKNIFDELGITQLELQQIINNKYENNIQVSPKFKREERIKKVKSINYTININSNKGKITFGKNSGSKTDEDE